MYAYDHLTSEAGRKVIANEWEATDITEAILKGLSGFDPFTLADPLIQTLGEIDQSERNMNLDLKEYFTNTAADYNDEGSGN